VVREMVTSQALAAASGVKRRQVLVMDEVDGMSGGACSENGLCAIRRDCVLPLATSSLSGVFIISTSLINPRARDAAPGCLNCLSLQ
jgi:hypothetical protein